MGAARLVRLHFLPPKLAAIYFVSWLLGVGCAWSFVGVLAVYVVVVIAVVVVPMLFRLAVGTHWRSRNARLSPSPPSRFRRVARLGVCLLCSMLTAVLDMIRQWRSWKQKRRRHNPSTWRRRTLSSPSLNTGRLYSEQVQHLDLAVNAEDLWFVEDELAAMEKTTARLLSKLSQQPDDVAVCPDDECIVCVSGRTSVHTFPCGHCVLCRKCFLRTIQMAVKDRQLPLRCVVCRSKIARLKYDTGGRAPFPSTVRRQPCPSSTTWPVGGP